MSNTAWKFETANLIVSLIIEPEDMDPADSFQFDEDIAAVRNGDVAWFIAFVEVRDREGTLLSRDSLGGCAYTTFKEFYTSHRDSDPMNRNCTIMRANHPAGPKVLICHYFPSMVAQACAEARAHLAKLRTIPVRA